MVQRIFNWDDWNTLDDGGEADFDGNQPRVVVLEVNAQDKVHLYIEDDAEWHFLAVCEGRDEVHFAVSGGFALRCVGGTAHFKTAETADWTVEPVEDTTFTTLVERRIRNPEMEQMMYLAERNIEKRIEAQYAEREARLARIEARFLAGNAGSTKSEPAIGDDEIPTGAGAGSGGTASGPAGAADGAEPPAVSPEPIAGAK